MASYSALQGFTESWRPWERHAPGVQWPAQEPSLGEHHQKKRWRLGKTNKAEERMWKQWRDHRGWRGHNVQEQVADIEAHFPVYEVHGLNASCPRCMTKRFLYELGLGEDLEKNGPPQLIKLSL
eukprot:4732499-Amphidinium_carterae.1